MKKTGLALALTWLVSSAALADQSWTFNLSDGTPASFTVRDGILACSEQTNGSIDGILQVGATPYAAQVCREEGTHVLFGRYSYAEGLPAGLNVLSGDAMEREMNLVYRPGFALLGNGKGGECPKEAVALLAVNGHDLGDRMGVGGYCLFAE